MRCECVCVCDVHVCDVYVCDVHVCDVYVCDVYVCDVYVCVCLIYSSLKLSLSICLKLVYTIPRVVIALFADFRMAGTASATY